MRKLHLFLIALIATALVGCSTTPTKEAPVVDKTGTGAAEGATGAQTAGTGAGAGGAGGAVPRRRRGPAPALETHP